MLLPLVLSCVAGERLKHLFVCNDEHIVSTIADAQSCSLSMYAAKIAAHVHFIFRIPLVCVCFSRSGCVVHWVCACVHAMNLS